MELNQEKLAYIHRKVDEVVSGTGPPGVDEEWIKSTTAADRLHALERLRWHQSGKERCQAKIKLTLEVVRQPGRDTDR